MASIFRAYQLYRGTSFRTIILTRGFRATGYNGVAQNFNMPAMSPTMTEGTIASWKVKEGDKFKAGDVLVEIETDKAQIPVEAQDDGIIASISAKDGTSGIPVGTRIAVLAEPDDDLSTLVIPDEPKATAPLQTKSEGKIKAQATPQTLKNTPSKSPHPSDQTPKTKYHPPHKKLHTPSPAVMGLLKLHNLAKEDISNIPATGPKGRLLKGDVLAYIGNISPDAPAAIEAILGKLAHLDLSNIKIKEAPAYAPKGEGAEEKKAGASTESMETDIRVEVSLDRLLRFQSELQERFGFSPPTTIFLAEASRKASQNLPPSKLPPTPDEIFNDLLGLPKKPTSKPYKPELTSTPVLPTVASSKSLDIIDILSGFKQKPVVHNLSSSPTPTQLNRISVTVNTADEVRGKLFLDRVKGYLEAEPEKLFVSWGEGARTPMVPELF